MVLRHLLDPSVALCACMLLAFGFIIHRIYLHPLSEYPGPWLAALSDWHAAYFAWSGQLHWTIHEWHQKYGPVIRIGPNTIIFQEIDAFTQIYGPHSNLIKSTTRYAAVSASHTPNLVTEIHQPTVNLKRKAYMDMWSYRSLKETEPRLHALIDTFHTIMDTEDGSAPDARDKDNWSETHDLSETGTYFGFDTVISMGTGHNPNLMLSPEHRYLPDASTIVSIRALASSLQPKLHLWKIDKVLLAPLYKRIMGLGLYYWRTTKAQAAKGITGERNLIQVMMQTKDKKREKEFSTKELWLEIFLLGAVGSTSVGPFVSSIFHFLVHSPAKLERLVAEIRQAFASEDEIAMGSKLDSCEYLWACVDELFRLMPVISNALPRTTPKGGCVIDGHFFGEGTQLGSSIFQIHRNEKYFSEPHEFKPGRYLGTKEEKKEGKKNFVAFSRGNRSCPGQGLAYTVMVELVARTLWKYDMRLAPETCCGSLSAQELHPHHEFDSYIGMKTKGPLVQLKKRQDGF